MGTMPREIDTTMYEDKLKADMGRYADEALELGASRAVVVSVSDIPVDDRVVLKCRVPRCNAYGVCANCPPNVVTPVELRELLTNYSSSLFVALDVPPELIVRDKTRIKERINLALKLSEIVAKIESNAFYDGHYLAFGLSAGSCRDIYCGLSEDCAAQSGKKCRFPLRSRPSMEAVGIDVFKMAARLGWVMYPIGGGVKAEAARPGTLCGLVVVQ